MSGTQVAQGTLWDEASIEVALAAYDVTLASPKGCWTAWSRSMPTLAWLSSVYVPRVVRDRVAEDRGAQADARRVDAVLGWQP